MKSSYTKRVKYDVFGKIDHAAYVGISRDVNYHIKAIVRDNVRLKIWVNVETVKDNIWNHVSITEPTNSQLQQALELA